MKFNRITDAAKKAIDKRGGMDALKGDLQEVQEIAKGRGSLRDKAKAAAEAVKTPGKAPARDDDPPPPRAA